MANQNTVMIFNLRYIFVSVCGLWLFNTKESSCHDTIEVQRHCYRNCIIITKIWWEWSWQSDRISGIHEWCLWWSEESVNTCLMCQVMSMDRPSVLFPYQVGKPVHKPCIKSLICLLTIPWDRKIIERSLLCRFYFVMLSEFSFASVSLCCMSCHYN